ncbi:MAG: hypothetical protein QXH30_03685 [Candidatus Bilamarchaeaceae archaeon]
MYRGTIPARERVRPLGVHTAVGHLHDFGKWKEIPYLRENEGMLPPFMISVGSRIRAEDAPAMLRLSETVRIDSMAEKAAGRHAHGRVSLSLGIATFEGFDFPILIAESQMGCPAAQINMKELLYFSRQDRYSFYGKEIKSDSTYVIRAGTCAGVNSFDCAKRQMQIGDLAIADSSMGSVGALIQSCLGNLHFAGSRIENGAESFGITIFEELKSLKTISSPFLVSRLSKIAAKMGLSHCIGANFTKDSLYAELGEKEFAHLRDAGGIISTEMEQMALDALAAEFCNAGIPVHAALIAAVVGAIPGKSFPETEEEKRAARNAEENAMVVACMALGDAAKEINK